MAHKKLIAKDGFQLGSYLAKPNGKPRGAIIVVQEIFGVNSHIQSLCDLLAKNGYVAIAPAVFDRIRPGFDSGYTPKEVDQAKKLMLIWAKRKGCPMLESNETKSLW